MGPESVLEPGQKLEPALEPELEVSVRFWMTLAFGPLLGYRLLDTSSEVRLLDLVGKWEDRVLRGKPPADTRCERVLLRCL